MDALKKAELAKRKSQPDTASTAAESVVVVAPSDGNAPTTDASRPAPTSSLPSLDHLELLDDEFERASKEQRAKEPAPRPAIPHGGGLALQELTPQEERSTEQVAAGVPEREAIQNLFETKQAAPAASSNKTFGIAAGAAGLVAALLIGGWFWSQLQPKSGLQPALAANARPMPATPITPPPPSAAASQPDIPGFALQPTTPSDIKDDAEPAAEAAPAPPKQAAAPAKKLFQLTTAVSAKTDPALDRGYDALKRNDPATAKAAYEQALNGDPRNIDALSGLAVIAQRMGNADQAADYYLRILEADPHNALALAGLINLQSQMNPAEAETRLKQALASQPDSATLNFSLGNVYARGKRWNEAQAAYFKAMAGDPGNPDYLFNLAISLDQLRQPKVAASYYAQAIAAIENRPGSFDKTKANERLLQLQQ